MKIPVDVTIYLNNFMNEVFQGPEYLELLEDFGIQDRNKFETIYYNAALAICLDNYETNQDPMMDLEQSKQCMAFTVTDYHLEMLQSKGLIESYIDESTMELSYKATPKGLAQNLLNDVCLN